MKDMEQIQKFVTKKERITDNIGGLQTLEGKYYSPNTMSVKKIVDKTAVIINQEDIDHLFISGNCLIVELKDKRRFMFDIKTEDK